MKKENRMYGVDIVRIIAVVLVIVLHFFYNTNYYSAVNQGGLDMKIQSIIRNFTMINVPLFMLITGFLNKKKEYNKSFFKGLCNILIVWFFYSLIEYFAGVIMNKNYELFNFKDMLYSITSFRACRYSWYIEMYIGLYLFSPILNNAYNSFNKKNRLYLLIITVFTIILPIFINQLFVNVIHIPSWWTSIYPIAYYIAGKYIADVDLRIKKKTLFILLILTQIITFSINYIYSIEHYSITTFISTILVFLLFYDINIESKISATIIKYLSNITLDIYLASSLIDKIIYPTFNERMSLMGFTQGDILIYAPIIIGIVLVASIIYGSIRKLIINVR